jgi:hypothetical protein
MLFVVLFFVITFVDYETFLDTSFLLFILFGLFRAVV